MGWQELYYQLTIIQCPRIFPNQITLHLRYLISANLRETPAASFSRRLKEIEDTQIQFSLIEGLSYLTGKPLPRFFSRRLKEIEDTQIYADSIPIVNRQSYSTGKSNNGF